MLTNYLKKSAVLLCIASIALSSCKKEIGTEAEPASLSASAQSMNQLMASTQGISPLAGPRLMLGINGHPFGDAPYLATPAATQVDLLKNMGMNWYRVNVQTMSDGTMSTHKLFEILQKAASSQNVNILPMLRTRTLDFAKSESESYQLGKTLGGNFAEKYGKYFTHYDLGNDLELKLLYPKTTGQSQLHYDRKKFNVMAAYLKGMDEGIKLKDPGAKTMIDAGWLHYGFLRMCDWYGIKFDIVAYHWYSDMENAAPKSPNNIPDITKKLSELFPKKPIWFTEFNYRYKAGSSTNEEDQKTFISNFINKCKNNPQVQAAIIYELFDEPYKSPQEACYGIAKWSVPYTVFTNKLSANFLKITN